MNLHLFCFGFGYTARFLARNLAREGWKISGTSRGVKEGLWTFPLADPAAALDGVTHILSSVPPGETGDPVLAHPPLAHYLGALGGVSWIGYLSTTGVYGNRDGGWVDEESALRPSGPRGQARVDAEAGWAALGAHRFRLAGIYGPGRNVLDTVRAGKAQRIDKPGQVFSRIHVEDIVQVLRASIARPHPGRAYNVCDDDPAPPAEVVAYACRLLTLDPPPLVPFADAVLSPMARSFYDDNKRVRNDRIKAELGLTLQFPSYRQGLAQCLQAAADLPAGTGDDPRP